MSTLTPASIKKLAALLSVVFGLAVVCDASAFQADQQQTTATTPTATLNQEWPVFSPTDSGGSFSMPSKPRYVERSFTPVAGKPPIKVHLYQSVVNEGNATFLFVYNDLHVKPASQTAIDKTLDGAVKGSVINVGGQLIKQPTKFTLKDKPGQGRQFSYRYVHNEKRYLVTARVFLVGKRQYQTTFLMLESIFNEPLGLKYLNSFKLVEPANDKPPAPRKKK